MKDPLMPVHGYKRLEDSGYSLAYFRVLNHQKEGDVDSRELVENKPLTLEICLLPKGQEVEDLNKGGLYKVPKEAVIFRIAAGAPWPNIPANFYEQSMNKSQLPWKELSDDWDVDPSEIIEV